MAGYLRVQSSPPACQWDRPEHHRHCRHDDRPEKLLCRPDKSATPLCSINCDAAWRHSREIPPRFQPGVISACTRATSSGAWRSLLGRIKWRTSATSLCTSGSSAGAQGARLERRRICRGRRSRRAAGGAARGPGRGGLPTLLRAFSAQRASLFAGQHIDAAQEEALVRQVADRHHRLASKVAGRRDVVRLPGIPAGDRKVRHYLVGQVKANREIGQCRHGKIDRIAELLACTRQAEGGNRPIQCRAMSSRRQIQTRSCVRMYSMNRIKAFARPGWPVSRMCSPTDIMRGQSAPSS